MSKARFLWAPMFLFGAALLAHLPALGSDFVHWDDYHLVLHSPLVQTLSLKSFLSYDPELYVPLSFLSYQIEHALFGFAPVAFHATNLLLHAGNTLLVFLLLRKLLTTSSEQQGNTVAVLGALVFAVHPLNTEAVSWVSARRDLLMTLFALASLLEYLKQGRKHVLRALLFFLLALLSKPTAIVLPLLIPLLDSLQCIPFTRATFKKSIPFFVLSALFVVINAFGQRETSFPLSLLDFLLLSSRSITLTLQKFFLPMHLNILYPVPEISLSSPLYLLSFLGIAFLAAALFTFRQWNRTVTFGAAFFFITLAPGLLSYMKADSVTLAPDHYAYLPSVGLLITLTALLLQFFPTERHAEQNPNARHGEPRRTTKHIVAALLLSVVLGWMSFRQSKIWKNSEALFTHAVTLEPAAHIAWNNLGFALLEKGNAADAEIAFTNAVALQPSDWSAHLNLATIAYKKGDLEQAEMHVRAAANINPEQPDVQFNLGGIHFLKGEFDAAIVAYRAAIQLKPDFARAHLQLAHAYLKKGMLEEAETAYGRSLELQPSLQGSIPELEGQ